MWAIIVSILNSLANVGASCAHIHEINGRMGGGALRDGREYVGNHHFGLSFFGEFRGKLYLHPHNIWQEGVGALRDRREYSGNHYFGLKFFGDRR